jgi:hypothetical protein
MDRPVTLRLASAADDRDLRRLAQLDTRALPPGPHLVAERGGRIDALISLRTGAVVANPFQRTAELCDLLRHAAARRASAGNTPRRRIGTRPMPAPA